MILPLLLSAAVSTAAPAKPAAPVHSEPLVNAKPVASYGKLGLHFEPNLGQWDPQVRFVARGSAYTLFLTDTESVMVLRKPQRRDGQALAGISPKPDQFESTTVRMKFVGAAALGWAGSGQQEGISNYYIGNDRSRWRAGVPHFAGARGREIYPGIDLVYRAEQRSFEYDFVVRPGADPSRIRLAWDGADSVNVNGNGDLVIATAMGDVVQKAPRVYQDIAGRRIEVASRFELGADRQIAFSLGTYDRNRELVIDPLVIVYSTYVGGTDQDVAYGIKVNSNGEAYLAGVTASSNFPVSNSSTKQAALDTVVVKLNAAGNALSFSTYLGGGGDDTARAIALDGSSNAYIAGVTTSTDFPLASALSGQTSAAAAENAFVVKLSSIGQVLYSTYLGGSGRDTAYGIAVDGSGSAYVAGDTTSADFPTVSPITTDQPGTDAFVSKITFNGSATTLAYSTYIGGSTEDTAYAITVDGAGSAYVAGVTGSSSLLPGVTALQSFGGSNDGWVAKLNAAGNALVWGTYIGGTLQESVQGIALDSVGNTYVTGYTNSSDFPILNTAQAKTPSGNDAFVVKINSAGTGFGYRSLFGGTGQDFAYGIAVDVTGCAYVTGFTFSSDFPTYARTQSGLNGSTDAFVSKLTPGGSALLYSTLLGGAGSEQGLALTIDGNGAAYATGFTSSSDFPRSASPYQNAIGGGNDMFVTKLPFYALPTAAYLNVNGSIDFLNFGDLTPIPGGGLFGSKPTVSQDAAGNTFVVARDTFNTIWGNVFNATTQTWGTWYKGAAVTQGSPSVAVINNVGYVVIRDSFNSYYMATLTPGVGFSSFTFLQGLFTTDPTTAACPDGSLYIIGKDQYSLYSRRFIPGQGLSPTWVFGGGILQGRPDAACGTDNVVYIATRDLFNTVWLARVQGSSWLSWIWVQAIIGQDPRIAKTGDGALFFAILDTNGVVYYRRMSEGVNPVFATPDWIQANGILQDYSPAGVSGDLFIAGRVPDKTIWWFRSSGPEWKQIGLNTLTNSAMEATPR